MRLLHQGALLASSLAPSGAALTRSLPTPGITVMSLLHTHFASLYPGFFQEVGESLRSRTLILPRPLWSCLLFRGHSTHHLPEQAPESAGRKVQCQHQAESLCWPSLQRNWPQHLSHDEGGEREELHCSFEQV